MNPIYETVCATPLFQGVAGAEFEQMLPCIGGRVKTCSAGEVLLMTGAPVHHLGQVLEGRVHVLREDADGRQTLVAELEPGDLFAEVFACAGITHSPVTVEAAEDSRVLLLNYGALTTTCSSACPFHGRLIQNMLALVARKALHLNGKLEILSKRTTRERLLIYFDQQRRGARRFTLPFGREALAAYLCVERSALSAELSRMQRDGLLRYHRNEIELLDTDDC